MKDVHSGSVVAMTSPFTKRSFTWQWMTAILYLTKFLLAGDWKCTADTHTWPSLHHMLPLQQLFNVSW